jgi:hypothetical protein
METQRTILLDGEGNTLEESELRGDPTVVMPIKDLDTLRERCRPADKMRTTVRKFKAVKGLDK